MTLDEVPHPLRLVVQMIHYSIWESEQTKHMKRDDLLAALGLFFSPEQLQEARKILSGEADDQPPTEGEG